MLYNYTYLNSIATRSSVSTFISKHSGYISLKKGGLILCLAEIQSLGYLCSFLYDSHLARANFFYIYRAFPKEKNNAVHIVERVFLLLPTVLLTETLSRLLNIYTEIPLYQKNSLGALHPSQNPLPQNEDEICWPY